MTFCAVVLDRGRGGRRRCGCSGDHTERCPWLRRYARFLRGALLTRKCRLTVI